MRPPLYRSQLAKDLDDWIDLGLVPASSRDAILETVDRGSTFGLTAALSLLGGGLIAAAVLSFIAANWQGLDKLPRLIVLLGALWASFGLAVWGKYRRNDILAEASLIVGIGVFGASIWFVSQTYHLADGLPDGLMLWSLGALAAALLAASQSSLTVGFLITVGWIMVSWLYGSDRAFWLAPVALALSLAYAGRTSLIVALQAGILATFAWLVAVTYRAAPDLGWSVSTASAALGAIAMALWLGLQIPGSEANADLRPARIWAIILMLVGSLIASFAGPHGAPDITAWLAVAAPIALALVLACGGALAARRIRPVDGLAALALGLALLAIALGASSAAMKLPALSVMGLALVWLIAMGLARDDRLAINGGFVGFGLWVVYLYGSVFDSFLNSALFFAVSGILLIALALGLDRVRRLVLTRKGALP